MNQWTQIRRAVLVDGLSKRKACEKFNISWDTLKRILKHSSPPGYQRTAQIDRPVIGPWLGRLDELLEERKNQPRKQRYTVKRIFDIIKAEGFSGGYTTVKDAVRHLRNKVPGEVFMPLIQPPGEAQVDFGHALANIGGKLQKITFFVMSLVHSDAMFVMAFQRECAEAILEAHVAAFRFFGFVPKRISYDNTRTVIAKILGPRERILATEFNRLVSHYLFEPHFCLVRRANEKGVVEGAVRYSRLNFMVPVPQVADFAELNAYLQACCESDMNRKLRGKTLSKKELLAEDHVAAIELPSDSFDTRRDSSGQSDNESLVRFDNNDYSVPVDFAYHKLTIKASTDKVFIYHLDKEIARHRRRWDKERQEFDPLHYLKLLERKPGSLDYGKPFADWKLPECFAILRHKLEARRTDGTREFIRVLLLLEDYPLEHLTIAIRNSLHWESPTADAIKQLLIPAEKPELKTFDLAGHQHLAWVDVQTTDPKNYGRLCQFDSQEVKYGQA